MNNPVHTTSDGRQLQRTFYTPYFMDALTGRNSQNYNSYYRPISEGMANVGNFFGRYNLYLDMAKPPTEYEQSWIDAANSTHWTKAYQSDLEKMSAPAPKEFKSNMPIVNPLSKDGGLKMWSWYSDPVYGEINDSIVESNNTTQKQPSRLNYIPDAMTDESRKYIKYKRQRDVEM